MVLLLGKINEPYVPHILFDFKRGLYTAEFFSKVAFVCVLIFFITICRAAALTDLVNNNQPPAMSAHSTSVAKIVRKNNQLYDVSKPKRHVLLFGGAMKSVGKMIVQEIIPVAGGFATLCVGISRALLYLGDGVPVELSLSFQASSAACLMIMGYECTKANCIALSSNRADHEIRKGSAEVCSIARYIGKQVLPCLCVSGVFLAIPDGLQKNGLYFVLLLIPSFLGSYHGTHALQEYALKKISKKFGNTLQVANPVTNKHELR